MNPIVSPPLPHSDPKPQIRPPSYSCPWALLLLLLAIATTSQAAQVFYSVYTATNATDTSWVSPADSVSLSAINFGGDETAFGGITWSAGANVGQWVSGNSTINPVWIFSWPNNSWGNNKPATLYGGAGPSLLDDATSLASTNGIIESWNYTSGTHYQVQFVLADSRPASLGNTITIAGSEGVTGSSPAIQYAYGDGRYVVVMADFLADAGKIGFNALVNAGTNGTQINAVQVLQVNNTFSLAYNGNGSTGGSAPVDGNSPYAGLASVTVLGNTGGLVKAGENFAGWNTTADGKGAGYVPGDSFVLISNTVLYAQWVSGYPVVYNGNGNTAGAVPVDVSSPYKPGATATVLGPSTLSKAGYTFAGWNTAADGTGNSRSVGSSFTVSGITVLYAQWTINQYALNYLAGGGGSVMGPANQIVNYGDSGTQVTAVPDPGYHFAFWSDLAKSDSRTDAKVTTNINVTAIFSADPLAPGAVQVEYTLGENGTDWQTNLQSDASGNGRIMINGSGSAHWTSGAMATSRGSTASWMVADGESANTMANATGMPTNYQVSLFQQSGNWGPNPTSEQYLFAMDGISITRTAMYNFNANVGATTIGSFTTPSDWFSLGMMFQRANGIFSYWVSLDGGMTWNQQGSVLFAPGLGVNWSDTTLFSAPSGDTNFFAGYVDDFLVQGVTVPASALTYDGNENTSGSAPSDSGSPYGYGASVTVMGQGTLTRAGYSFLGWNTSANGAGTLYFPGESFRIVGDTTLHADWVPNNKFAVTYRSNGGLGGTVPVDYSSPYLANAMVTVLGNSGGLNNPGSIFLNWNTKPDGAGTAYNPDATFQISTNTLLYAHWGPSVVTPPTLTYTVLSGTQLMLQWTGGGTLQASTNSLNGAWNDYPGTSPVTVAIDTKKVSVFFRVKQ